jgi:predicted RNA-binding Zn ribbon-like protein
MSPPSTAPATMATSIRKPLQPGHGDEALAAPADLELVRRFVNTRDLELETDVIATPESLDAWLAQQRLMESPSRITQADVARVHRLREGLRGLLLRNAGVAPAGPRPSEEISAAASGVTLGFQLVADDLALRPTAGGVEGALGRLLSIVFIAQTDGSWTRLKACPGDRCQWALYDHTRNRSRTWCDPAKCGSRTRARNYRRRRQPPDGNTQQPHEADSAD